MGRKFKNVGIIGKYDSPNLSRPLAQVIAFLVRTGYQVVDDDRAVAAAAEHDGALGERVP